MMSRRMQILLAVSLALNVFALGAIVSRAVMHSRAEAVATADSGFGGGRLRQAAMQLEPQYRQALRRALGETMRDLREQGVAAREARIEAVRLLAADPLDRAALDAALARARTAEQAIRAGIEASVVAYATNLPPDQRIVLSEALQRAKPRERKVQP